jgi:hypothetical protein
MTRLALILLIPAMMGLQGCALLAWNAVKPVEIQKKAVERTPLNLADPQPLKPSSPNWIIITPANAEQVWAELRKRNADLVLFALTDDGYEELAVDMAQIRTFIAQQREIIVRYRQYYEPPKPAADAK